MLYPNRAVFSFFQHPCSDYLFEGPSTGKNFDSARLKFGTDRLFHCKFYPSRTLFLGPVPTHFHPSRAKNFL